MEIDVEFSVAEDDAALLPPDASMPARLPDASLIPQRDDIVMLSPSSAWMVMARVFHHLAPDRLRVQVWLAPAPAVQQALAGPRRALH